LNMAKTNNHEFLKRNTRAAGEQDMYDVIVIGLGVAGLSAAMYSARLGLKTLAIGEMEGGTITLTDTVENYPGFISIKGQKLAKRIEAHASAYGTEILIDKVDDISSVVGKTPHFNVLCGKKTFLGRTVILATGRELRKLEVEGEVKFTGNGVSYCALCDITLVKGKTVVVVGGGNSAVKEANLLAKHAKEVFIINNEPELHAEKPNMRRMESYVKNKKMTVINSNEVVRICGDRRVEKIVLKEKFDGRSEIDADWVFIYIGYSASRGLARKLGVELNEKGEIIINRNSETNVPGIFAAGDVTNLEWKQAIIGVAQGVSAAYHAEKFINNKLI